MAPQLAGAPPPGVGAFADGAGAAAATAAAAAAAGATAPRPVQRVMNALAVDVAGILCVVARSDEARRAFREQVLGIEGVLVACLGHASLRPRAQAVRLLNALYDGVDWQLVEPIVPVIAYVGDEFCVDVFTTDDIDELYGGGGGDGDGADGGGDSSAAPVFRVLVSAPPFGYVGAGGAAPQIGLPDASEHDGEGEQQQGEAARPGAPEAVLTMHVPSVEREDAWVHAQPAEAADAAPGNGAGAGTGAGAGSVASPASPGDNAPSVGSGSLRIDVGGGGAAATPPSAQSRAPPSLVRVSGTRIRLRLSPFARCGFVDWRVVVVLRDGSTRPVTAEPTFAPPPRAAAAGSASALAADAAGAGAGAPLHFSLVLSPTSASASASASTAGASGEAAGGAASGSGGASSPSSSAIFPAGSPIASPRAASRRSGSIGSMSPSAQAAAERRGSASGGGNGGAGGGAGFAAQQLQYLQVS